MSAAARSSGNTAPLFRCAGTALLRAPLLPRTRLEPTWLDFPADDCLSAHVGRLGSDPELHAAVALASPSLARLVAELREGRTIEPKRLRKAVLSLTRYQLRMAARPTPFGLFSGVTTAGVSDVPGFAKARLGSAHRVAARPDMGWLTALLTALETRPDTLAVLRVVVNELAFVRGDRLVLPYVPERHGAEHAPGRTVVEVSVRCTPAVRAVLDLAGEPLPYPELERQLLERFPGVPEQRVADLLRPLVEREFLLTDLRPPATATDPLAHVLDRLPAGPEREELAAVHRELDRAHPGTDYSAAIERMRRLHEADRLLQVDLALDADVTLPAEVAAEAQRAAEVLWRVSPTRTVPHLAQYHGEFVERYSTDRLVPLTELLDPDRGLGAPAGYLMPPSEREKPAPTGPSAEDALRIELAQTAIMTGRGEVVLDDALLTRLSPDTTLPPPASLELYARVLAGTAEDLTAGRFRLWLTPGSGADHAGATVGRFSHVLPEAAQRIASACGEAEAGEDVEAAQLVLRAARSRSANLNQVRRLSDRLIVVGAFADRTDPGTVALDDLAVGADLGGLYLVRLSSGRRIVPLAWNMLNPQAQVGNVGRFLRELRLFGVKPGFAWDWGPMEQAPYTPRVRYGRTVLAPARWRPSAPFFADTAMPQEQWRSEFDRWRQRWGVPDHVLLCVADRSLELNLAAGLHVRLLRQDVARWPEAVLREAPTGEDAYGWLSGPQGAHTAEVVFPLLTRRCDTAPDRPRPALAPTRPVRAKPPGGEWLYAKVYASARRQNELLTSQLPRLLAELPGGVDRWFFLRYRDPEPHLRLRFHGDPTALNRRLLPKCHDWFADLRRSGLAGRLVLDTYEPEWERYGGQAAMTAAEDAFCADSAAVIAQLSATETGRLTLDPVVMAALNMLDIARLLHEEEAEEWLLDTYPRSATHDALRDSRTAATRLSEASALRALPGGAELLASWQQRAGALVRYREVLRGTARTGLEAAHLVHMHHNRLLGIDPDAEQRARSIARGAAEAARNRHLHHARVRPAIWTHTGPGSAPPVSLPDAEAHHGRGVRSRS
ncbi:lantibiotic dehydratase [Kitasatospora sp. NPDC101155]|uniref:lantibiotic dehydratase n=1 Tax=Kitasatospora sp. NPDC101155 TaxID=3364097 RepID=UPI0037F3F504